MKIIIIIAIIAIIWCIYKAFQPRENSEGEIFEKFTSGNAFGSISANQAVTGVLKKEYLYIYEDWHKDINVSLPYSKITNVKCTSDVEILEKSKSVAGRALIGGLVLGPVGALFGGMSGIGTKQERQASNYILITYKSTPDSEENGILLKVGIGAWSTFMKILQEKANVFPEKSVEL